MFLKLLLVAITSWHAFASPVYNSQKGPQKQPRFENRDALHRESHPHHELKPRNHPDHDAADHAHLVPRTDKSLFWAQRRLENYITEEDRWVAADTTFKYPSVVLDHSSHIRISIDANVMTVIFLNEEAFETSADTWIATELPFLLVTAEGSEDGHFQYFHVNTVECLESTTICLLEITPTNFDSVVDEFKLTFGHYDELIKRSQVDWTPDAYDAHLDSALGYYDFGETGFANSLHDFAEGLNDTNIAHYRVNTLDGSGGIFNKDGTVSASVILEPSDEDFFLDFGSAKRDVQRRQNANAGNAVTGTAATVANTVSNGVQAAGNTISQAIAPVASSIFDNLQTVTQFVNGQPQVFNGGGPFNIPSDRATKIIAAAVPQFIFSDAAGPFTPALTIFFDNNNRVSCLGCRLQGTVRLRGTVAFSLASGLQQGVINFDGDFTATIRIGLEAKNTFPLRELSARIFELGIPGFSVPGFINVGPILTLDASASINLGVPGTVMAGAVVGIAFNQDINLLTPKTTAKPVFRKRTIQPSFEASAEAVASFTFSLPIGIALGISIGNGQLSATAAVISEPGVEAAASPGGVSVNAAGLSTTNNGCNGLRLSFSLVHSLFAEGTARLGVIEYNTPRFPLAEDIEVTLAERCFPRRPRKRSDGGVAPIEYYDLDEPAYALTRSSANATHMFNTRFNNASYHMPAAVAQYTSSQGPPSHASIPTSFTNEDGTLFNYTIISETSWRYNLVATPNGGISLESSSAAITANELFAVYKSVVIGGSLGRILVYFGGEMDKYGVSRIRLEPSDRIPKSSRAVGLVPIGVPRSGSWPVEIPPAVLVATDSVLRTFLPVLCHYKDGVTPNKMFVVKDLKKGIETLLRSDTDKTLTGGTVDKCQYLALNNGLAGLTSR